MQHTTSKVEFNEKLQRYEVTPDKVLISIDWLTIVVKYDYNLSFLSEFDTSKLLGEHSFEKKTVIGSEEYWLKFIHLRGNTNHFRRVYAIMHKNTKICELECEHNGGVTFGRDVCRFKINNLILYNADLQKYIFAVLHCLEAKSYSISRIDLCGDNFNEFKNFIDRYQDILYYDYNYIDKVGRKFTAYEFDFKKRHFKNYDIGSKTTGLCLTIYHKGDEIEKKSGKDHIREFFKVNSIDIEKAYRVEIKLTKKWLKNYYSKWEIKNGKVIPADNSLMYNTDDGVCFKLDRDLLDPSFLLYCQSVYWMVINEIIKIKLLDKETNRIYPIYFKNNFTEIQRLNWETDPSYLTQKMICSYYLRQYIEHGNEDVYNYKIFVEKLMKYDTYFFYYLEKRFIAVIRMYKKTPRVLEIYEYLLSIAAEAKRTPRLLLLPKYDKLFERK